MKERPILFSAPMVRAILDGRKTQTRRIMKPQPEGVRGKVWPDEDRWRWSSAQCRSMVTIDEATCLSPYGFAGDRLWVKETFARAPLFNDPDPDDEDDWSIIYRADGDERPWSSSLDEDAVDVKPPWRPSIFMPRWASRITLEVQSMRVQRLHEITEEDARAEGVESDTSPCDHARRSCDEVGCMGPGYRAAFCDLWHEINGSDSWDANPWVWTIEFSRVT